MFRLIQPVFTTLLSFCKYFKTKCKSLNNKLCMIRPSLISLNPVDLNYY